MNDVSTSTAGRTPRNRRRELEALLRKKAEEARRFPLSFVQQRLWVLDQLDPGNPVYNVPLAVRLRGALDLEALNRTLNAVIVRHETLRTRIAIADAQPVQVVEAPTRQELAIVDLEGIDPECREAEAVARATAEVRRPFRLDQPLFRVVLLRLSPMEHILVVVLHHIISDDWSMAVLVREVAMLYLAFRAGRPAPLEPLPIQYADYATWQRQHLQGATLQRLLDYWRPQLQNISPLELPTDHSRALDGRQAGATESLLLPAALAVGLREVARREGATLYMILLAAYQVLLYRYSGQGDFAVGSPIAGRIGKETEGLVGCFVNTLALRARLDTDATFRQVLSKVRQTALQAFQHQELPFERLVEALNPERDTSRHPLFQVTFALQSAPWPEVKFADINFTAIPLDTGTSKFDLSFIAREQRDGLSVCAEYGSPLLGRGTVVRMLRHFQSLLEGVVADVDQPISRIPLLSDAERRQILVEWNDTARDDCPADSLHQLIEAQVRRSPAAAAVEFEGQHLTYRELDERANQLAHYLRSLGVRTETRVGISVERSLEMVVGLLGILKSGGTYVPLDPAFPRERRAFMLRDSDVSVLLTQSRLVRDLPESRALLVCLDTDWNQIHRHSVVAPVDTTGSGNLAYVLYTSGSTGTPKGVQISHGAVVNFLISMRREPGITAADTLLAITTLSFDIAGLEIYLPLTVGARVVVVSQDVARDATRLIEEIDRSGASVMQATPATWRLLVHAGWKGSPRLRALCGGEALPCDLARQLLDRVSSLWNMYGPTETTIWSGTHLVTGQEGTIPIGRPIANTQFYVLDSQRQPVPIGVIGELCIGGDGLARGYRNRPELTAEKFIDSPFSSKPPARIYRTGDLVRYLPDGNIQFVGRLDRQVKIRGFRIELGEIQAALVKHPAVREAAVTAFDTGAGDKELAVYWVAGQSAPPAEELRGFLQKSLPEYMIPTVFVPLEALPLSPNGKIDYKALPAPVRQRDQRCAFVAPRTPEEKWLAGLWREILHVDQVGVHDNFFTLGGHSLLATQALLRINREFSLQIPLRDLFDAVTIEKLGQRIVAARRAGAETSLPPIQPAPRDGLLPMAYNQEPFWVTSHLQQGPPPYAFHPVMRINGPLDVAALEQALNEIVRRHEPLRTTFAERGDVLVQQIAPYRPWQLKVVDLSQLVPETREEELRRYAKSESERAIDLVKGPLLRLELLKLSAEAHVILVGRHHIMYDGWSLEVLSRELVTAYFAFLTGLPAPLPDLPIQYADFAVWQRDRLQGEVLDGLRRYWLMQLQGLPILDLPLDRPRPSVRTTHGAVCERPLPGPLGQAVRQTAKQARATTFMTMLAAFQVLLYRYSGQEDFAISTPVSGRLRPETENLIGCFINDLVLRADLTGDPTFYELLGRVRETVLQAFDHQEMPFMRLVQDLNPPRDPSRRTLVQTELILHNVTPVSEPLPGLELSDVRSLTATEGADFDLCLEVFEEERGFQLRLCYQSDLFDKETMVELLAQFQTVLEAATTTPDRPLSQLAPDVHVTSALRPVRPEWGAGLQPANDSPPYTAPRSEAEKQLAAIWARVLKRDRVGVRDDFFESGGNSLLAVRMMTLAGAALGVELPIAVFFAAPTIAGLALHIESARRPEPAQAPPSAAVVKDCLSASRWPATSGVRSLVALRSGGPAPPLFCIHGMGGHVACFWPLTRGLTEARRVFGLQGRGLEPGQQPQDCIEDMALAYLNEIEEIQPCGPYQLVGWSMGGLIALEAARRLNAAGEEVALVAMLDTSFAAEDVPARDMDDHSVLRWLAPRLNLPIAELKALPLDRQWERIGAEAQLMEGEGAAEIRRLADVCRAHLTALADYSPEPYLAPVTLLRTGPEASLDPRWRTVCPQLRVERVPGNHYTMLRQPHVKILAERLDCILAATACADEMVRAR